MKKLQWMKWVAFCLPVLMFCACGSSKKVAEVAPVTEAGPRFSSENFISQVASHAVTDEFMTAKMKFTLRADDQNISVGGNLKMKKDDVIQLSLIAFGFVEAGRMEFTKDGVLFVDRINKQYVRTTYDRLTFMKEAELDFYTLQALFRNTLFMPGKKGNTDDFSALSASVVGDESAVIAYQNKKLRFKFLSSLVSAMIQQTQIIPIKNTGVEFNWRYSNLADFNGKNFPLRQRISLTGMEKNVEVDILLSKLSGDSKWETRTNVRDSYTEVDAEVLLKKLLRL